MGYQDVGKTPASTHGTYKGVELNANRDKASIDAGLAAKEGVSDAGADYWSDWDRNKGSRTRKGYEDEAKRLFNEQKKSYENANKDTMQDRNNMLGEIAQFKATSLMNSEKMNALISNKSEELRVQSHQIEQNVVQQFASMGKAVNPFIMGQVKMANSLRNADSVNQFTIGLEKERAGVHSTYLGHLNNVYEQTERNVMDAGLVMQMVQQLGQAASGVSVGSSGQPRVVSSSGGSRSMRSSSGGSTSKRARGPSATHGKDGGFGTPEKNPFGGSFFQSSVDNSNNPNSITNKDNKAAYNDRSSAYRKTSGAYNSSQSSNSAKSSSYNKLKAESDRNKAIADNNRSASQGSYFDDWA